jgi:ABC-2 type transport system ATP-binding protein
MTDAEVPAVELAGIHKRYRYVPAIRGISLTVPRGEFFGLVGPNGAGKTTLVEIAEGLRKPDSGSARVLGMAPGPRNEALLRRIGVQTQSSPFFTRLTAREHLHTVAALYRAPAESAERALAMVDLEDTGDVRVDRLSGGQRQRLAIASALTHDPDVIFLDEPTASLDPQARRALWETLRALKAAGRTIVYTTHHLDEAEALCDRIAVIVDGLVIAIGSPQELMRASSAPSKVLLPSGRITAERASRLDGVESVTERNGSLIIATSSTGRVLTAIGVVAGLDEVQTRTATLEDIYLELTGAREAL